MWEIRNAGIKWSGQRRYIGAKLTPAQRLEGGAGVRRSILSRRKQKRDPAREPTGEISL